MDQGPRDSDSLPKRSHSDANDSPMVFDSILPASVRSGISALQSLRRADRFSIISLRRQFSFSALRSSSTEELVLTSSRRQEAEVYEAAMDSDAEMQVAAPAPAASAERSVAKVPQTPPPVDVRWKYAEQGMKMHEGAYLEKDDSAFSRKSYVDGLAYMLMALPDDLSEQEAAKLWDALPPSMADANRGLNGGRGNRAIIWMPRPESRTALQRCVAAMVATFVKLIYVLSSVGMHYERKHNISQQIASRSFVIVTEVGRHGLDLSTKICAMKDGRVGKAVSSLVGWTAEGVTYGIQDGVGQGLTWIETKSEPRR
ncbi:hypothetical protein F4808DRAFT_71431 [Astrocystis sublimbata]|nr:hypothetical protein F4808DRAFT_71431 [Astrocystis sublimbata]